MSDPIQDAILAERERIAAASATQVDTSLTDLIRENERLRGSLRHVTDRYAALLDEGFPKRGRSADDRDSHEGWWEDSVAATQRAYATLAGEDDLSWRLAHPGLYIPPPGPVRLEPST